MSGWRWFRVGYWTPYDVLRIALTILLLSPAINARQLAADPNMTKTGPVATEAKPSDQAVASETRPSRREATTLRPELKDHRPSGPYCGINSLFACLSALGIDVDPADLISVDYVGSHEGSSVAELIRAAEHMGARATRISHMTWRELRRATTPMILHTRESFSGREYDHWVAFLGMDGNRVRICDSPHPLELYSMAELLANWDGTAVVISRGTASDVLLWGARLNYLLAAGLLLLAVYLVRRVLLRDSLTEAKLSLLALLGRRVAEAGAILALSLVLAIGWHAVSEIGFFNNPRALAEVKRRYYSVEFPILTLHEAEKEIDSCDSLVLDARASGDYRHGRIPGAMNMPIHASLPVRQELLADVVCFRQACMNPLEWLG